ncbi:hypothetical protein AHAS_Ahas18G0232700 [Arachis hypogaea]
MVLGSSRIHLCAGKRKDDRYRHDYVMRWTLFKDLRKSAIFVVRKVIRGKDVLALQHRISDIVL